MPVYSQRPYLNYWTPGLHSEFVNFSRYVYYMQSRKIAFLVDRDTVVGVLVKADHHRLGWGIAGIDRPILRGVGGSNRTVPHGSAADLNKTDNF